MMSASIVVTGVAGFIGMHVAEALLARGELVLGLDNLNDYYDPTLKEARLARLSTYPGFQFERIDIADRVALPKLLMQQQPKRIVHLAAQAGVRYSITHPHAYIDANVSGFLNILESARALRAQGKLAHLVYASSSSVYGANTDTPFSTDDRVDHPVSLYAATKRANELMASVYARQFDIPCTGLRFFTVYGPWGRPDMAAFKFTHALLAGTPIDVYNHGDLARDFTYIEDVVRAVVCVLDRPAPPQDGVAHALYNIGNHQPEPLMRFIDVLAGALNCTPKMNLLPMQAGDVFTTYANTEPMQKDFGWRATTTIDEGIPSFVSWYRAHYNV